MCSSSPPSSLRVEAKPFIPSFLNDPAAYYQDEFHMCPPIRLRKEEEMEGNLGMHVYELLDKVPFTPTMGVCSPSPTNWAVNRLNPFGNTRGSPISDSVHAHYFSEHYPPQQGYDTSSPDGLYESGNAVAPYQECFGRTRDISMVDDSAAQQNRPVGFLPLWPGSDPRNAGMHDKEKGDLCDAKSCCPPKNRTPSPPHNTFHQLKNSEGSSPPLPSSNEQSSTSLDKRAKTRVQQCPEIGSNGELRLNARQRRTLRRAESRLMGALDKAIQMARGGPMESSPESRQSNSVKGQCRLVTTKFNAQPHVPFTSA